MKKIKTALQTGKVLNPVYRPILKKSHLGWVIIGLLSTQLLATPVSYVYADSLEDDTVSLLTDSKLPTLDDDGTLSDSINVDDVIDKTDNSIDVNDETDNTQSVVETPKQNTTETIKTSKHTITPTLKHDTEQKPISQTNNTPIDNSGSKQVLSMKDNNAISGFHSILEDHLLVTNKDTSIPSLIMPNPLMPSPGAPGIQSPLQLTHNRWNEQNPYNEDAFTDSNFDGPIVASGVGVDYTLNDPTIPAGVGGDINWVRTDKGTVYLAGTRITAADYAMFADYKDRTQSAVPNNSVITSIDTSKSKTKIKFADNSLSFSNIAYGNLPSVTTLLWTARLGSIKTLDISQIELDPYTKEIRLNEMPQLEEIKGLSQLDTSNITSLYLMFAEDSKLKKIDDISNWNTSNLVNIGSMFRNTQGLSQDIDLSKWDISKVTDVSSAFQATSLTSVGNLSSWKTGNVTNFANMFNAGSKIQDVGNLKDWDVSKATDMSAMFQSSGITDLGDLSSWDVSKVTNFVFMFNVTPKLTNIGNIDNWNVSSATDMGYMFQSSGIKNMGSLKNWNVSNVLNFTNMFSSNRSNNTFDLSLWNMAKATNINGMFQRSVLNSIGDISGWKFPNIKDLSNLFFAADFKQSPGDLNLWNTENITNISNVFQSSVNIIPKDSNFNHWNVSNIINMTNAFNTPNLETLDISSWNTGKAKNMANMFPNNANSSFHQFTIGEDFGKAIENPSSRVSLYNFTPPTPKVWKPVATGTVSNPAGDQLSDAQGLFIVSENQLNAGTYVLVKLATPISLWTPDSHVNKVNNTGKYGDPGYELKILKDDPYGDSDSTIPDDKYITVKAKGIYGTVKWYIDNDNILHLSEGTLQNGPMMKDGKPTNPWAYNNVDIAGIAFDGKVIAPANISGLFADLSNPSDKEFKGYKNFENFDTSNVTDMSYLFFHNRQYINNGKTGTDYLDLGHFDTKNVTNAEKMFENAILYFIKFSDKFVTTNITDINKLPRFPFINSSIWYGLGGMPTPQMPMGKQHSGIISSSDPVGNELYSAIDSYVTIWSPIGSVDSKNNTGKYGDSFNMSHGPQLEASKKIDINDPWKDKSINYGEYFKLPGVQSTGVKDVEAKGIFGTVKWYIDNNTLYLSGGSLENDKVGDLSQFNGESPWSAYIGQFDTINLSVGNGSPDKITLGTHANALFKGLNVKEIIGLKYLDVSKVTDVSQMFADNPLLTSIKLDNLSFDNTVNYNEMFANDNAIEYLDLSNLNTVKATSMTDMFKNMTNLKKIKLSNKFVTTNITDDSKKPVLPNTDTNTKWQAIGNNGTIDSPKGELYTQNPVDTNKQPFIDDTYILGHTLSPWSPHDDSNTIKNLGGYGDVGLENYVVKDNPWQKDIPADDINDDTKLLKVKAKGIWGPDTQTGVKWYITEDGTMYLSEGIGADTNRSSGLWNQYADIIKKISIDKNTVVRLPKDSSYTFYGLKKLEKIDNANNLDTSQVTDMRYLFYNTTSLTELDVSDWDTSQVTNMRGMFSHASALKTLDLSKWNTSKVEYMYTMFQDTKSLESLDLSKWDTNQVTDMSSMFQSASSLKNLDVSTWDTSNVKHMYTMFQGAKSLESLDLSNWDTRKVVNMNIMFHNMDSLSKIIFGKNFVPTYGTPPSLHQSAEKKWREMGSSTDETKPNGKYINESAIGYFPLTIEMKRPGTYILVDHITTLTMYTKDDMKNIVSNVVLDILDKDTGNIVTTVTSDKNGKITTDLLFDHDYIIKQHDSIEGYEDIENVEINTLKDSNKVLILKNLKPAKDNMPMTGSQQSLILFLVVTGLLSILGIQSIRKNNKDLKE